MGKYESSKIIYLDESGIRKNEAIEYGWAIKGQKLYDTRDGSRNKYLNIIGVLKENTILAPFAFEGSCDTDVFNVYLQNILKPILTKGTVIVLDNASFHRSSKIEKIAAECGATVEWLPPYSPDFNKIEGYWHSIKTQLRRKMKNSRLTLMEVIEEIFMHENLRS